MIQPMRFQGPSSKSLTQGEDRVHDLGMGTIDVASQTTCGASGTQ